MDLSWFLRLVSSFILVKRASSALVLSAGFLEIISLILLTLDLSSLVILVHSVWALVKDFSFCISACVGSSSSVSSSFFIEAILGFSDLNLLAEIIAEY